MVKPLLIVDDEPAIAQPMARYFRDRGYEVVAAHEPEEADALLEYRGFALVVLDLALTRFGTEGLEVLRAFRQKNPWTPVVILSAFVSAEVEGEAERSGADVVLRKPCALADLERTVRRLAGVPA